MESITRKTLLYKSKVNYADYAINHVLGCAHGCLYPCYAFLHAQRYNKLIATRADWTNPRIVENAMDLLKKDLTRIGPENIEDVHMCFTTDPFMYDYRTNERFPEIEDVTLLILIYLWNEGVHTTTLTKGVYPVEALSGMPDVSLNKYGITLVSLSDAFQRRYEPCSAPFQQRIDALRKLHEIGLYTWVSMEPFPTPNIDPVNLGSVKNLMDAINFVDKIVFGPWNYNRQVKKYIDTHAWDFYSETAGNLKAYCLEREIEFYDKRDMSTTSGLKPGVCQ